MSKKTFKLISWFLLIVTLGSIQADIRGWANTQIIILVSFFLLIVLQIRYYQKYKKIL